MIVNKYGVLTSSVKQFHPNEPLLLIRPTDPFATVMAAIYYGLSLTKGCSEPFCEDAMALAKRIEQWQLDHPELVKTRPD